MARVRHSEKRYHGRFLLSGQEAQGQGKAREGVSLGPLRAGTRVAGIADADRLQKRR